MLRHLLTIIATILSLSMMETHAYNVVVADSASRVPLQSASVYDRHGNAIGVSNHKGLLPKIAPDSYPITIKYR